MAVLKSSNFPVNISGCYLIPIERIVIKEKVDGDEVYLHTSLTSCKNEPLVLEFKCGRLDGEDYVRKTFPEVKNISIV